MYDRNWLCWIGQWCLLCRHRKPGQGKEIHITDAIKNLIFKNEKFYGNIFKGKYLDCGTLNGYIKSGIEISKENR